MRANRVFLPSYVEMKNRRDKLVPKFKLTSKSFEVSLEDCFKSTSSSLLSFLEVRYPELISSVDENTELCMTAKVSIYAYLL